MQFFVPYTFAAIGGLFAFIGIIMTFANLRVVVPHGAAHNDTIVTVERKR